jgi:nitrogen fixation-related uncharacterized protein
MIVTMGKKHRDTSQLPLDDKGKFVDPFTGEVLVPVGELQEAAKRIPEGMTREEADRILQERIGRGDIRLADAVRETGIDRRFLSYVTAKIKPDKHYLPDGSLPTGKPGEKTVPGSELVFKHPISARGTCISKGLLDGIKKEFDQYNSSKKIAGYWSSTELSKKLGGKQKAAYLMRTFKHALEAGVAQINYHELAIPRDAFIQYGNKADPNYAISEYWGQKIVDAHNSITDKPEHMLAFSVFCKEAGMNPQNPRGLQVKAIFDEAEKQYNDPVRKDKPVRVKDIDVDCGYFRSEAGAKVFCFDRSLIERFNLSVPDKPEGMFTFSVFVKAVPTNAGSPKGQKVRAVFEAAEKQFDDPARNGKPVVVDGIKIDCGRFKNGHSINFCLNRTMIAKLGLSELPEKPATMLAYNYFVREAGISNQSPKGDKVRALFDECERQWDDPERNGKPVVVNGVKIACGRFKSGTIDVFCLDTSMIEKLNLRWPDKPEHMLPPTAFIREAGMSPNKPASYNKVAKIFDECERQFDDPERKGKPIIVDGAEIDCGRFRSGKGKEPFCLNRSMIARLGLVLPEKPENMLSLWPFCTEAGTTPESSKGQKIKAVFDACEQQFNDPKRGDNSVVIDGVTVNCGRFKHGVHKGFFLGREMIERLGLTLVERPSHMVSYYEFCMETGIRMGKRADKLKTLFEEAERQFDDPDRSGKPVVIDGIEIDCGRFKKGASEAFCLSRATIDRFKIILPDKPADMLSFNEFVKKARSDVNSPRGNEIRAIFEEAERQFDDSARGAKPVQINGIDIDCGRFKPNKGMDVFCLNNSMIERLSLSGKPRHMLVKKLRVQKTTPAVKIGDADETALPDRVRAELEEKSSTERSK